MSELLIQKTVTTLPNEVSYLFFKPVNLLVNSKSLTVTMDKILDLERPILISGEDTDFKSKVFRYLQILGSRRGYTLAEINALFANVIFYDIWLKDNPSQIVYVRGKLDSDLREKIGQHTDIIVHYSKSTNEHHLIFVSMEGKHRLGITNIITLSNQI